MKNLLPALFTLLSLLANAQEKAAFEVHFSPNYTKHIIDDKGKMGFNSGINLTMPLKTGRLEGVVGLQFSSYGSVYKKNEVLIWESQILGNINDPAIEPSENLPTKIKFVDNFYFLEMPIGARCWLNKQKIGFFIQSTLNPSLYLANRSKSFITYPGQETKKTVSTEGAKGIRTFNIFSNLSIGIQLPFNDKSGILIQPHGGIQLLPLANDSSTGARLYSAGLDLAFRYRFY